MHKSNKRGLSLNLIAFIIVSIFFFGFEVVASNTNDKKTVKMNVVLEQPSEGKFFLNIALTNTAKVPLSFYQHDLPWEFRYSLQVLAVKAFLPEGILEESLPVVDPGGLKEVQLKPDETLHGKISLDKRFHALAQDAKKQDIIIFWTYQLELVDGSQLDRLGGWLLIPKQLN
ncbi:MAG: hypothetical protein WBO24_19445 [Nitrospirales bacterium]